MRWTTSLNWPTSREPSVVCSLRTWMCTQAAPAFAASIDAAAICFGVTGKLGCFGLNGALPVTAQVIMTLRFTGASRRTPKNYTPASGSAALRSDRGSLRPCYSGPHLRARWSWADRFCLYSPTEGHQVQSARYSALALARHALSGHRRWPAAWRDAQ